MNNLDGEYAFVHKPMGRDDLPSLSPNTDTEGRDFRYAAQAFGTPPLVFENGAKEYNAKRKVRGVKTPPEVLFCGSDLVVTGRIREALLDLDFANVALHPAVYIHDDGKWYENYWFVTFLERLDCWDRKTSNFETDAPPVRLGGFELFQIYTYHLDDDLLKEVPLNRRLLFKMGGSLDAHVVCHASIDKLFRAASDGASLTQIPDY